MISKPTPNTNTNSKMCKTTRALPQATVSMAFGQHRPIECSFELLVGLWMRLKIFVVHPFFSEACSRFPTTEWELLCRRPILGHAEKSPRPRRIADPGLDYQSKKPQDERALRPAAKAHWPADYLRRVPCTYSSVASRDCQISVGS